MRLLSIFLLGLLTACGNANDGSTVRKKAAALTTTSSTPTAAGAPLKLLNCSNFTVLSGTNPSFAEAFSGSSVCKVDASYPMVQLKVGMNFPSNGRFCLVPATEMALPETCFSTTDAMLIHLSPSAAGYGSLVIVAESDLNAYKAYLNFQSNSAPPRAIALMNQ